MGHISRGPLWLPFVGLSAAKWRLGVGAIRLLEGSGGQRTHAGLGGSDEEWPESGYSWKKGQEDSHMDGHEGQQVKKAAVTFILEERRRNSRRGLGEDKILGLRCLLDVKVAMSS